MLLIVLPLVTLVASTVSSISVRKGTVFLKGLALIALQWGLALLVAWAMYWATSACASRNSVRHSTKWDMSRSPVQSWLIAER